MFLDNSNVRMSSQKSLEHAKVTTTWSRRPTVNQAAAGRTRRAVHSGIIQNKMIFTSCQWKQITFNDMQMNSLETLSWRPKKNVFSRFNYHVTLYDFKVSKKIVFHWKTSDFHVLLHIHQHIYSYMLCMNPITLRIQKLSVMYDGENGCQTMATFKVFWKIVLTIAMTLDTGGKPSTRFPSGYS